MNDHDWFSRTLTLPDAGQFPAIATRLARGDADEARALWDAWRHYVRTIPPLPDDARVAVFAAHLRRGVEKALCITYPHVAWVARWGGDPTTVPHLIWELLADDAPLTGSAVRLSAGQPGQSLVIERVQAGGTRLSPEARGPFTLTAMRDDGTT